ncbi:alpha/beta hydrolase [Puniceibacterium sediminis]|uniref:Phospholipase/carboxylesterase n=1 Tax=Puniceibacterium sediminis TaxID=1608407 RepID=A0A238VKD4_9RHOB|nr:alpha/beta hydrolase [Puniceibacterium sediminis]SNR34651.1 phospholipase/carboxylesterase [Puniceibacterium sediminis]
MTDYVFAETKGAPGAPLIFTFHGTGGSETQFHALASQILPEAHVVSPRGDVSEGGMARYFRRTGEGVYDMADLARRTDAMATFLLEAKNRVGADRVIALGYSNGANIAASVAFSHPEIFTDLALMHPLIPWDPAPQPGLIGARILITAGERDPICPAPLTHGFSRYLSAQGAGVIEHWHPGGHEIVQSEVDALQAFMTGH